MGGFVVNSIATESWEKIATLQTDQNNFPHKINNFPGTYFFEPLNFNSIYHWRCGLVMCLVAINDWWIEFNLLGLSVLSPSKILDGFQLEKCNMKSTYYKMHNNWFYLIFVS